MPTLTERLERLDKRALRAMRTRGHAAPVEAAARGLARSGEHGAVWLVGGLTAAAIDRPRRGRWLVAAGLGPVSVGLNLAVKLAVRRPRPKLKGLPPLGDAPSSLSFPSAHATASFAAATAMGRIQPRARPGLLVLASLMGLTRPYLGMHYPTDVLAGAALGTVIGNLAPVGAGAEGDGEYPAPGDGLGDGGDRGGLGGEDSGVDRGGESGGGSP